MVIKKVAFYIIPAFYFGISWLFPWEKYQWDSSISVSYFFDCIFVLLVATGLRVLPVFKIDHISLLPSKLVATFALASFVIFLNNLLALQAPFRYVDKLAVQLLFLAPVIEEFVFRFAFFALFKRCGQSIRWQIITNSGLFSLSHIAAIWILPAEFREFIVFQVGYTFALGWVCTKARMRHQSLIVPILMHFVFNLTFYMAIKFSWI
jgi:membrane protease YdiL (CAAX protease family)